MDWSKIWYRKPYAWVVQVLPLGEVEAPLTALDLFQEYENDEFPAAAITIQY
jgi:hypothetical protein